MAAPAVRGITNAVISATGTATSPSATEIGDLVLTFVWSQGTSPPTHTIQSGFTELRTHSHDDGTTDGRLSCASKVATAAGAQSYQPYAVSGATAGQTCAAIVVISALDWANSNPAVFPDNSSTSTGTGAPNPPSLTGLTGDWLVLAAAAWHVTTAGSTTTTQPTNYTERVDGPTGSHVTHLAVASRALTGLSGSTEDPGAFTDNVTPNGTASMTIGIPMQIAGTATPSTGAATSSGDGDVLAQGEGAATLGAVTSDGDADAIASGTATPTLGAATLSATGEVTDASAQGDLNVTLGAATAAGTGVGLVAGTATPTLGAATASGAGAVLAQGEGAATLGAATASSSGGVLVLGTGSNTLGAATLAGAAGALATGTGTPTLGAAQGSGSGIAPVAGALSSTLGAATLEATGGGPPIVGDLDQVLGAATASGTAGALVLGTGAATLGTATVDGDGAALVQGGVETSTGVILVDGAGVALVVGDTSLALDAATLAGSGSSFGEIQGNLNVTLDPARVHSELWHLCCRPIKVTMGFPE